MKTLVTFLVQSERTTVMRLNLMGPLHTQEHSLLELRLEKTTASKNIFHSSVYYWELSFSCNVIWRDCTLEIVWGFLIVKRWITFRWKVIVVLVL